MAGAIPKSPSANHFINQLYETHNLVYYVKRFYYK